MKPEFRNLLTSDPELSMLSPGGIHWGLKPASRRGDYITLQRISGEPDRLIRGRSSLTSYRIQVDCYALNSPDADAIADRVQAILDGHRSEPFPGIFLDGVTDDIDGDEEQPIYRTRMDFAAVHRG